ncbi:MAG: hypothetical protein K8W52_39460 [Deltaproteobacteria bacterium]|nr:hypothetical protein [Deltaproteobacteria bacterium]
MTIGPLTRAETNGICSYGGDLISCHTSPPALDPGYVLVNVSPIHTGAPGANPLGEAPLRLFCPNGDCAQCSHAPCATIPPSAQPQHLHIKAALSFGVREIHIPGMPGVGPMLLIPGTATLSEVRDSVSAWTAGHGPIAVHVYLVHPTGGAFPVGNSYLAVPVQTDAPGSVLHPLHPIHHP